MKPPPFPSRQDRAAQAEFLRAILNPAIGCAEIRVLSGSVDPRTMRVVSHDVFRSTLSVWSDDAEHLMREAARIEGVSAYITVNPVNPALKARADRLIKVPKDDKGDDLATTDDDIVCLASLFIDIDPDRPSGISATEAERLAGLECRDKILADHPEIAESSLWGCSGNGQWILIKLAELPNDAEHNALVKSFNEHLGTSYSAAYSGIEVKVDPATCNPSRIMPLVGTIKCKGVSTAERPHRPVTLDSPPDRDRLPFDLKAWMAAHAPPPAAEHQPAPQPESNGPPRAGPRGSAARPRDGDGAGVAYPRPGISVFDDFDARTSWDDLLSGWTKDTTRRDGEIYLTRPGKDGGPSATIGYKGKDILHVFTSKAPPFEAGESYTKCQVYALLKHGGDMRAAVEALSERRFGTWIDDDGSHRPNPPPKDWAARHKASGSPSGDHPAAAGPGATASSSKPQPETQSQVLLRLAGTATLFHDPTGRTYAAVPSDQHTEVHEIGSTGFRRWLKRRFYDEQGRPPAAQSLQDALGVLDAQASYDGPEEPVFIRVAGDADRIVIDLGDPAWRAVEIDAAGWRVITAPPVRFRRPAGLRALPEPARGEAIARLRDFVNLEPAEFLLLVAWLAAALRPTGPYPILVLSGEQGSAKSTLARLARLLIDPHVSLLRSEPREPRDLMVGAVNGWLIALDNLSALFPWLSDSLCRLSTGGGFATRTLYTNDEETFLDAMRPVILTGITDFVSRGDLVDRSVFLHLPTIPEDKRRTESEFWQDFASAAPLLLGALFDAVWGGIRELPDVRLTSVPRMADFALFGEAVSRALGNPADHFLTAYRANRQAANESALEDSPVAGVVRVLVQREPWTGTATELRDALGEIAGEKVAKSERWPKSPRGMSGALRRLAPALRAVGIEVEFGRGHDRYIFIQAVPRKDGIGPTQQAQPSLTTSLPSQPSDHRGDLNGDSCVGLCVGPPPVGTRPTQQAQTGAATDATQVVAKQDTTPNGDGYVGGDGRIPTQSIATEREVFEL
jgi:hypothetical protein